MSDYVEEQKSVEEFRALLLNWGKVYRWEICSYFGIKSSLGNRLIYGRILYETEAQKNSKVNFHIETKRIIAGQEIIKLKINSIDQRLNNFQKGKVKFLNHSFSLINKKDEKPNFIFYPIYPPVISDDAGFPIIPSLVVLEKDRAEILTMNLLSLNWELKSANKPFNSIDELLSHIELPHLSQMGDSPMVHILAKSPAHISHESTIKNNKVSIVIDAFKNLDTNKIRLGCKVFKKKGIERFTICSSDIKWTKNKKRIIGFYDYSVDNLEMLQAFLSYEHLALHSWYITDPAKQTNPRAAIHKVIDDNFAITNKYLLEPSAKNRKEQDDFELGVASLLHVLGFSVSLYGQIQQLQDGPDIIAFTPNGNIAIIECTTGLIDNDDKLAKLNKRTISIKETLKNAGLGHFPIQPIIISKLPRAQVTAHFDEAGKHGIAVVCKEDLEELLKRTSFYPNPEKLFQEASQLIPKNEQLSFTEPNSKI